MLLACTLLAHNCAQSYRTYNLSLRLILVKTYQGLRGKRKISPNASACALRVRKPKNPKTFVILIPTNKSSHFLTHTDDAGDSDSSKRFALIRESRATYDSTGIAASTLVNKMLSLNNRPCEYPIKLSLKNLLSSKWVLSQHTSKATTYRRTHVQRRNHRQK